MVAKHKPLIDRFSARQREIAYRLSDLSVSFEDWLSAVADMIRLDKPDLPQSGIVLADFTNFRFSETAEKKSAEAMTAMLEISNSLSDSVSERTAICDGLIRTRDGLTWKIAGQPSLNLESYRAVCTLLCNNILKSRKAKMLPPNPFVALVEDFLRRFRKIKASSISVRPTGMLPLDMADGDLPLEAASTLFDAHPQGSLLDLTMASRNLTRNFPVPRIATDSIPRLRGGSASVSYADRFIWQLPMCLTMENRIPDTWVRLCDPEDGEERMTIRSLFYLLTGGIPPNWRKREILWMREGLEQINSFYFSFGIEDKDRKIFNVGEVPNLISGLSTRLDIQIYIPPSDLVEAARIMRQPLVETSTISRYQFSAHIKLHYLWDSVARKHAGFPEGKLAYGNICMGGSAAHLIEPFTEYDMLCLILDHQFVLRIKRGSSQWRDYLRCAREALEALEARGIVVIDRSDSAGWRFHPPSRQMLMKSNSS